MYNEYSYPYIIKKRSIGFGLRRPRRTLQAGTSRSRRLNFVAGHSNYPNFRKYKWPFVNYYDNEKKFRLTRGEIKQGKRAKEQRAIQESWGGNSQDENQY